MPGEPTQFLRINIRRVDYVVSDGELNTIKTAAGNHWKDFFLFSFALCIPLIINAITEIYQQKNFHLTISIFLNSLVGVLSFLLSIPFMIMWIKTRTDLNKIIAEIKSKPEVPVYTSSSGEGRIELGGHNEH